MKCTQGSMPMSAYVLYDETGAMTTELVSCVHTALLGKLSPSICRMIL